MKPESLEYQERIVAFVDVLGFAKLVKASEKNAVARTKISKLIGTNKLYDQFMQKLPFATATFFSDSFVLSMARADQAIYMVREIGYLCHHLLLLGLPCRGAITVGSLYHNERVVVGPAFVDAYLLEQSVAIYPRIILDDAAMMQWKQEFRVDEFGCGNAHPCLESLIRRDRDGQYFIDIFHPKWGPQNFVQWTEATHSPDSLPTDAADFLKAANRQIQDGIAANIGNLKIRAKYEWLASESGERDPVLFCETLP